MLKLKQQGFVHILLIIFLLAGLAVGVYLVQQKTNILPKASGPAFTTPTTSFELSPAASSDNYYKVGDLIPVNVRARSDISAANLFNAKITFDKDSLAVDNIYTANSFIKNWVENTFDNNAGTISLIGGVPSPGYKTDNNSDTAKTLLMAVINFKVLKPGSVSINLTGDSAIFSNADNINILAVKTGTVIKTGTGEGSPAPTTDIGMPPLMPMRVYGNVTVNGKTAGAGVVVSAKIGGVELASKTTDSKGRYGMSTLSEQLPADTPDTTKGEYQIPADKPGTTAREGGIKGDTIQLYVDGVATQTTTFDNGKVERVDLSVSVSVTPVATAPVPVATTVLGTGDGNKDGKVDLRDMSILLSDFGKANFRSEIDMNVDKAINTFDVLLMRKTLIQKGVIKGS